MEVLDIVQSAAFKSGVISSFNPDDCPGDVIDAGRDLLRYEILPGLNCDRTLDITVTSRVYPLKDGRIVLKPYTENRENFAIAGYIDKTSTEMLSDRVGGIYAYYSRVEESHPDWVYDATETSKYPTDEWPTDDFGKRTTYAFWTTDTHLVYVKNLDEPLHLQDIAEVPGVNIEFMPMRVDTVLDEHSRIGYEYLYREEFEKVIFRNLPGCYTTEEYEDSIIILLHGTPDPKRVVLPVPLQIVNVTHEYSGKIVAPEKFRRYLIDCTAVALARTYGMSSLAEMEKAAAVSYNLLKKNKPQPLHRANVTEEITDKLRTNILGRRFYANI